MVNYFLNLQLAKSAIFVVLVLSFSSGFGQTRYPSDNFDYEGVFLEFVRMANLKFIKPDSFNVVLNTREMRIRWDCSQAHDQNSNNFKEILKNSDSTLIIGIDINVDFPKTANSPGNDVNWKQNMKNRSARFAGKNNRVPIDSNLLKTVWMTDFGVEYCRPCTIPYRDIYNYHKIIAIGHENWELEIVFFYKDKDQQINFVDMASKMFVLKT